MAGARLTAGRRDRHRAGAAQSPRLPALVWAFGRRSSPGRGRGRGREGAGDNKRAAEAVAGSSYPCALRPRRRAASVRGGGRAQRRGRSSAPRGQLRDGHLALGQRGGAAAQPRLEGPAVPSKARPADAHPARG